MFHLTRTSGVMVVETVKNIIFTLFIYLFIYIVTGSEGDIKKIEHQVDRKVG